MWLCDEKILHLAIYMLGASPFTTCWELHFYFFYLSNARRFYSSMGKLCSLMGLTIWNTRHTGSGGARPQNLGGKIDFCPCRTFVPPQGDSPQGDEYPRNITPPPEGQMPQENRPPFRIFAPIYAMWFIQIIS